MREGQCAHCLHHELPPLPVYTMFELVRRRQDFYARQDAQDEREIRAGWLGGKMMPCRHAADPDDKPIPVHTDFLLHEFYV